MTRQFPAPKACFINSHCVRARLQPCRNGPENRGLYSGLHKKCPPCAPEAQGSLAPRFSVGKRDSATLQRSPVRTAHGHFLQESIAPEGMQIPKEDFFRGSSGQVGDSQHGRRIAEDDVVARVVAGDGRAGPAAPRSRALWLRHSPCLKRDLTPGPRPVAPRASSTKC